MPSRMGFVVMATNAENPINIRVGINAVRHKAQQPAKLCAVWRSGDGVFSAFRTSCSQRQKRVCYLPLPFRVTAFLQEFDETTAANAAQGRHRAGVL
jgi:hypothetical protein